MALSEHPNPTAAWAAAARALLALEDPARASMVELAHEAYRSLADVPTVQVVDNVVDGTVQGIHVGTSDRTLRSLHAGEVMIARNVVHAVVPVAYDRDRHGIFVGNARSVHVVDNAATLTRPDAGLVRAPTAVEGVRVHGVLGPFLVVRHTSCQRFTVGVRVVPLPPIPGRLSRMWLVAETMAAGGTSGAILPPASDPAFPVEGERNVP
jgi:hypothetical protein